MRRFYLRRARATCEAADRNRQICSRGCAAAPHHAYVNTVTSTATEPMDDYLVDQ